MLNLLLALTSAALLIFIFPSFNITWFAPVALTPLLVAMARELRPLHRFLIGWAAGFVYWFGVCYWIRFVLAVHGGMSGLQAWLMFLLFCVAKALHLAFFSLAAGVLMRRWWAVPSVAAWWVAVEVTHGSLGFAWLTLGNAGVDMGIPMRLAPFTGVYGLSFVFVMMSVGLALAALRRPRRELLWLAVLPLLLLLPAMPPAAKGSQTAFLVQSNISETEEWTRQTLSQTMREQAGLSLRGAMEHTEKPPSIIVWPEVPAPFYYDESAEFREFLHNVARMTHAYMLAGTVSHTRSGAPLNSAQLVSPEGGGISRYDKINLVPFGEFVPWPFGYLAEKVSTEVGDFAAGTEIVVSQAGNYREGTFICYESVFPNFVRKFANQGAEVLFNISNDGWFGPSAARHQHLNIVRMRAAENRRWILRATNDGITAAIDSAGRLRATIRPNERAGLYTSFTPISQKTFYTRFGDWFAALCALIATFGVVASFLPVSK